MEHDKQGKLLIKRKFVQRLMCLEVGQLFSKTPSHLFRRLFAVLIDAWEQHRPEFLLNVKRREGWNRWKRAAAAQKRKSMIHNSPLLLETLAWWTADEWWMLWRMSRGQREPTERSIVLRWPVKKSIIPRSHLWLTPFFPTGAGRPILSNNNIIVANWTREFWFNHNPVQKYITQSSLAYSRGLQAV